MEKNNIWLFDHKATLADKLNMALRDEGADSVEYDVQSNDGTQFFQNMITHLHLAKFKV